MEVGLKELYHHGILGQKWGERNGPPYPLKGGDYSADEKREVYKARKASKNNIYNKKHFDKVMKKGETLSTLSYNKDRTKDVDMFYAAYTNNDKHQYNALFNKKVPQDIIDENGNNIGTGEFYKFRINNEIKNDIQVASEDSGANAFIKLYNTSRDFSNFVRDPDRMQGLFVEDKYKFSGYRESRDALERIRSTNRPTESDLRLAYRMMNYVIPSDGGGDTRKAKDINTQRARLFNELKNEGYGGLLDTNDAIYGGFKADAPVIIFDMDNIALKDADRVTTGSKIFSNAMFTGSKVLKSLGFNIENKE